MFIVKANVFNQGTPDKNGLQPLILVSLDGTQLPTNSKVVSGTIAHNEGIVAGESYAVNIIREEDDVNYGEQYTVQVIKKLSFLDLLATGMKSGVITDRRKATPILDELVEEETVKGKKASDKIEI